MKSVNPLGLVFQFYVNIFTVAIFFKFFLILYELIGPPIFWDLWSIWLSRHGHAFTLSIFQFTEKDWQLNLGHQTAYGRCCIIMVCRRNKLFPPSPSLSLSHCLIQAGDTLGVTQQRQSSSYSDTSRSENPTLNTQHWLCGWGSLGRREGRQTGSASCLSRSDRQHQPGSSCSSSSQRKLMMDLAEFDRREHVLIADYIHSIQSLYFPSSMFGTHWNISRSCIN